MPAAGRPGGAAEPSPARQRRRPCCCIQRTHHSTLGCCGHCGSQRGRSVQVVKPVKAACCQQDDAAPVRTLSCVPGNTSFLTNIMQPCAPLKPTGSNGSRCKRCSGSRSCCCRTAAHATRAHRRGGEDAAIHIWCLGFPLSQRSGAERKRDFAPASAKKVRRRRGFRRRFVLRRGVSR